MPLGVFLLVGLKNMSDEHMTYKASDLGVMGCVVDVSRVLNEYKSRTSRKTMKGIPRL